jgi:hypothetical protein
MSPAFPVWVTDLDDETATIVGTTPRGARP